MLEIKFTLDATPELIGALRDIAGAIHSVSRPIPALQNTQNDCSADAGNGTVICAAFDDAKNLTAEASIETKPAEAPTSAEDPKKRKPRAKKSPSGSNPPVAPAVGDKSSPVVDAEHERYTSEETNAPETAQETAPETAPETAQETAPVEEATAAPAEDPLAGKGQAGEILAELTRKAIGDLDALGVDRGDANRRIRDYCACNEIKFPTFPALLQAVGYADAIAICKGAWK